MPDGQEATRPSRRELFRGLGWAAGALAVGGGVPGLLSACGPGSGAGNESATSGGRGELQPVKLGWWGATCEAPLFVAHHAGFFAREGLTVELVNLGQASAKDAIASGKVDGAPGITFEWLKPIEQGQDIRVTGGLHGGCLRLVTGKDSGITDLKGLVGKTLATDGIGGSAHSFFTVVLANAGIDPTKDVTFVSYPGAQLQTALERGEVAAVAAADPFPFLIVADGKGVELASNLTGTYKDHYCCAIGLNGALIDKSPRTAAALTRAWLSAAAWIGTHPRETAEIETRNNYVPIDAAVAAKLLSTYYWTPSVTRLQADIGRYANEFKATGILEKSTDPKTLARTAFADVTGGDAGIDASTPVTSSPSGSSSGTAHASGVGHAHDHVSPGGVTRAAPQTAGPDVLPAAYQLTAAQREQLFHFACHHGGSPAGRVA